MGREIEEILEEKEGMDDGWEVTKKNNRSILK